MRLRVVDPAVGGNTTHGRAVAGRHLSDALGGLGVDIEADERPDVVISLDAPPPSLGQIRSYVWLTSISLDWLGLRRWRGGGEGRLFVAANAWVARTAKRAGLVGVPVVPLGAPDALADAPLDVERRRSIYVCSAAWSHEHGTCAAVEAFRIAREQVEADLYLFGDGEGDENDDFTKQVRRAVRECPPHGSIRCFGRVSHESVMALLPRMGILLHMPRVEDRGLAVVEAMAAGCAVVMNTTGALASLGAPVRSAGGDSREAARQIVALVQSETTYLDSVRKLGMLGRRLTWKSIARAWRELL